VTFTTLPKTGRETKLIDSSRVRFLFVSLVAVSVYGQVQRPPGFVLGVVTANGAGAVAVRTSAGSVYQYRTDAKTWIERDHERIRVGSLEPGEMLEVVSDRDPEPVRYARMIHVIEPVKVKPLPVSAGGVYRLKPAAPLATGVYVGLVVERERDRIRLRTRFDGDQTIYLQADTQCLQNGDVVDAKVVLPLMRVYVVATRDSNRELIANQVIWGVILEPEF
jgi:hypothetical protein